MKKLLACIFALLMLFSFASAAGEERTWSSTWNIPESNEMTDEVRGLFDSAMENLTGVNYEPLVYMGSKDGVYCIFCRATAVYPDAVPYYTLVYVTESGIQNIWDIWMDSHSTDKRKEKTEPAEGTPETGNDGPAE